LCLLPTSIHRARDFMSSDERGLLLRADIRSYSVVLEKLSSADVRAVDVRLEAPIIAYGQSGAKSFDACTARKAVPTDVFDSYLYDQRYERVLRRFLMCARVATLTALCKREK